MKFMKREIILNKKDAVFGRGRKRDHVRKGSLYRYLIEKYWLPYSKMNTSNVKDRRAYVKLHVIDVLIAKGGRFIVRGSEGEAMYQLYPSCEQDLKLIFKKVQRALFNERKRREMMAVVKGGKISVAVAEKPRCLDNDDDDEEYDECPEDEEDEYEDVMHPEDVVSGGFGCEFGLEEDVDDLIEEVVEEFGSEKKKQVIIDQGLVSEEDEDGVFSRRCSFKLDCLAKYASTLFEAEEAIVTEDEEEEVEEDYGAATSLLPLKKRMVSAAMGTTGTTTAGTTTTTAAAATSTTTMQTRSSRRAFEKMFKSIGRGYVDGDSEDFNRNFLDTARVEPLSGNFEECIGRYSSRFI